MVDIQSTGGETQPTPAPGKHNQRQHQESETNRDEIVTLGALELVKMHATQLEPNHCRRTRRKPQALTGRPEALHSAELFSSLNNNRGDFFVFVLEEVRKSPPLIIIA